MHLICSDRSAHFNDFVLLFKVRNWLSRVYIIRTNDIFISALFSTWTNRNSKKNFEYSMKLFINRFYFYFLIFVAFARRAHHTIFTQILLIRQIIINIRVFFNPLTSTKQPFFAVEYSEEWVLPIVVLCNSFFSLNESLSHHTIVL